MQRSPLESASASTCTVRRIVVLMLDQNISCIIPVVFDVQFVYERLINVEKRTSSSA